jgi:hypothetical protein
VSPLARLSKAAGLALLAAVVLPRPAVAYEWCVPDTAKEAYNALLAGAPDGSELENAAKDLKSEREADGEFNTEETLEDLDDLAIDYDYLFDCDARIYRYAPEDADKDDPNSGDADDEADLDEDEEAVKQPTRPTPATTRPTPATTRPTPTTTRPAPAAAPRPAPAVASQPAPSSASSGSYAGSYSSGSSSAGSAYSYYGNWASTATTAPAATPSQAPTQVTSAPVVKSLPEGSMGVAAGSEREPASKGPDRRIFLIPAALGIALGVDVVARLLRRRR